MINSLISGVGFGFLLTIMLGPVFFGLLQTSINKGFKFGVYFAIGVAVSDVSFILITYFGIAGFLDNEFFQKLIGIFGGIFMSVFGLYYFFKPVEEVLPVTTIEENARKSSFILKGFVLNIFNPSVLFFWVGVVSFISVQYEDNHVQILSFFTAAVITVLTMDILKSYIANKIKKYFTTGFLKFLNKGLGAALFLFGLKLIYDSFAGTFHEHGPLF
ncbi:LysE family translocator [Cytophagaceae bacterium ABcell3]|nr:LysE family translocator [Cytophagaceae bacterium ABcell3]